MVSHEHRQHPEHSLKQVQKLALAGHVSYGSRRVVRDVENLGYTPEDIHHCLASLTEAHYRGSVRYQDTRIWLDEYLIGFTNAAGYTDDLYIKLKLSGNTLVVLASFHRER